MPIARRISEHRPTVIALVLVTLSVISLAAGRRASIVNDYVRTAVSVLAYPFLAGFNAIEGSYDYATGFVASYNATRAERNALQTELSVQLQRVARYEELKRENARLRAMLDFERDEPRLSLEPVEVILRFEGMLMIDRGSVHGMREAMSVMTKDGIIGIITRVDPLTSNVITLHSAECKVDALIRRNRVRGIVRGTGSEVSTICRMEYIDLKDDVRVGDDVVTSPDSIFPSGYPVGKVVAVHSDQGSLLKIADVRPAADPYSADEVFVLRDADPAYQDLARVSSEELPDPMAPHPLLDERSIQERFAP